MTAESRRRLRRTALVGWAAAVCVGLVVAVVFGIRALDAADASSGAPGPVTTASTTTDPPTTTTTTTAAPTTAPTTTTAAPTTTTTPPDPTLRRGDEGPEVLALQQRLAALNYWLPEPDGTYGALTSQAVMAFQKHAGLGRDGIAGPVTLAALATASPVQALEAGNHVEISLERQLLVVVHEGRTLAFNTSTGRAGWRTPAGRFTVTREIDGVRHAPLGRLYRPKYFHGGIAVHGSDSIPGDAASHGCARLSNAAADLLWTGLVPIGTPVWVY